MSQLKELNFITDLGFNLYQFEDPRSILQVYVRACKNIDRRYSLRHFSLVSLQNGSPGYIQSLIKGSKPITDQVLERLIQLLGLQRNHQEYFTLLVKRQRELESRKPSEKLVLAYNQRINKLNIHHAQIKTIGEKQAECCSSWLHLLIREMALLQNSRLDLPWIQKCLATTIHQSMVDKSRILKCLNELQQAELIKEVDGEFKSLDPAIQFEDEAASKILRANLIHYHQQGVEQASIALKSKELKAKNREYATILAATTSERLQTLKQRLKEFNQEIIEILLPDNEQATLVAAVSIQLFPAASVK